MSTTDRYPRPMLMTAYARDAASATIDATVLLSSAGRRGALVAALRDGARLAGLTLRIVATDASELSAAANLCDGFYLVPPAKDSAFIDSMLRIVDLEGPLVVVPTIDTELAVLAENLKLFADAGADVIVSDPEVIEICSDKARSNEWMRKNGFPVPRQYGWNDLIELPTDTWPLFFKPMRGSASIGAQPVSSITEFAAAVDRFGDGVVEHLVEGVEYTVDCWVDGDGRCRAAVPRRRLAVRAGEISKGVTERFEELETIASAVAETLPKARGPVTVQAIAGPSGPEVIEINPRFGGGYPLTHEAGCTFTAALVAEVAGVVPDPNWFTWRPGVTMLRYDEAVFIETPPSEGE